MDEATAGRPRSAAPTPLSHKEIVTILIGLMMGMFLAALDQTIVASAMRVIADDLNDLAGQAWVTTAYLITATITTPLYGKLGDIYGRKKLFLFAITIFTIGSMLCTFAWSIPVARRLPRGAGPRRRRPLRARPRDHRRHRAAARAGEVPGLLPRRLRHLERHRPGRRRPPLRPGDHPRHRRLALGLPRQRADRHRRAHRRHRARCTSSTPASTTASTTGARWPHRHPRAAAHRGRAGPPVGLELPDRDHLLRHRRARLRRVHPHRALDGARRRSSRCASSATAPSPRPRSARSSSAWACSAVSPPCRSTCRSSRARARCRPACSCCP